MISPQGMKFFSLSLAMFIHDALHSYSSNLYFGAGIQNAKTIEEKTRQISPIFSAILRRI